MSAMHLGYLVSIAMLWITVRRLQARRKLAFGRVPA